MEPRIPTSGHELYNELMSQIEPELTTDQLPLLAERYRNEHLARTASRASRYTRAYSEYDQIYEAYVASLREQAIAYRKYACYSLEQENHKYDLAKLNQLEAIFTF